MRRLQYLLFGLLLFVFAAPMPSILILQAWVSPSKYKFLTMLANKTLRGVIIPEQNVALSLTTWMDGSFQRSVTKWANESFAGREIAIRCFNQLLWSTCGKSYMNKENLIAGQEDELFEKAYLDHFSQPLKSPPEATIQDIAKGISRVNIRLRSYNVPFCVIFTPSKPVTLPNTVPSRYRSPPQEKLAVPRDYDRLKTELNDRDVPILDGAELTRSLADRLPLPPFPKTGTHWTDLAAFHTAEALLRKLSGLSGKPLAHLQLSAIEFTGIPRNPDADLLRLLNLAFTSRYFERYAYAKALRGPEAKARQGRLVLVGGSFVLALNRIWEQAEVWREIDFFYYFTRERIRYPGGSHSTPVDVASIDWRRSFGIADGVALEINEASITGRHIPAFLDALLKGLPETPPQVSGSLSLGREVYLDSWSQQYRRREER